MIALFSMPGTNELMRKQFMELAQRQALNEMRKTGGEGENDATGTEAAAQSVDVNTMPSKPFFLTTTQETQDTQSTEPPGMPDPSVVMRLTQSTGLSQPSSRTPSSYTTSTPTGEGASRMTRDAGNTPANFVDSAPSQLD